MYKMLENFDNTTNKFESYKDLVMFYQTTIRNVALTTAVSFAALGYSRFYRGKSKLYAQGMVIVSLCILISSSILNYFLYNSVIEYSKLKKFNNINELLIINYLFILAHTIAIIFAFYTLYRLFTNNTFIRH